MITILQTSFRVKKSRFCRQILLTNDFLDGREMQIVSVDIDRLRFFSSPLRQSKNFENSHQD